MAQVGLQSVRPEVIERTPRPRHCQSQALFSARAIGRILGALIERHTNVRTESDLHIHRMFRRKKMAAAVEMGTEPDALVRDLAQLRQTVNLKAARVAEHGSRPTHESMQTAHAPDRFMSRAQIQMVCIPKNDLRA